MKALTVKQPWASLIVQGIKDIENRTFRTHFRGRVFIHSSAKSAGNDVPTLLTKDQYEALPFRNSWHENIHDENFPFSSIIGSVEIVDCIINHPSVWAAKTLKFGNCVDVLLTDEKDIHKPIYNWVLDNPVLFDEPIPNVKGKLSFWEYELPAEFGHYEFLQPSNG